VLLWILVAMMYLCTGPVLARRAFSRKKYYANQLTECAYACKSRTWHLPEYKDEYCSCGFRNLKQWKYYWYASPLWPAFLATIGIADFISRGEYEPREVKAARRAAELEKVRVEFEERTQALERAAGIRSD
jgi:hypothetical protein